jgi:hypothetical protein
MKFELPLNKALKTSLVKDFDNFSCKMCYFNNKKCTTNKGRAKVACTPWSREDGHNVYYELIDTN